MVSRCIAALVVASCVGANAFAQVNSGLNEVSVSASFDGTKIGDSETITSVTFTGAYGRFLSNKIEVGPQFTFLKSEVSDASGTISGFAAYHFNPGSTVVSFAGGEAGWAYGYFDEDSWTYGSFGGVKAFLGHGGAAVAVQPFWRRRTVVVALFDLNEPLHEFGVSVGISIFFH